MADIRSVAIVGVGRAGLQHARAAQINGIRVVAHASRSIDSESSQAFRIEFPESKPFSIGDPSICEHADLVVLSVPPDVTHRVASGFIESSQQILIEKPAALSTCRIRELLSAERESGCVVAVGYNRRSYPLVLRVRDILQNDPPTQVDVTIVEDMDYVRSTKNSMLQFLYLRHGSSNHFLDLLQFLVGTISIREIRMSKSARYEGFIDFSFSARCGSGAHLNVSIDAGDRSRRGLRILTSSGCRIDLSPLEHLSITPRSTTDDVVGFESAETLDRPDSYAESFVLQLRKIAIGDTDSLHRLSDSLRLSMVVDELELASSEIRNE
jgi:predicted dehydrogenase